MRKFQLYKLSLSFIVVLFSQNSFSQDFHQLSLPEGAKARLGKGLISGNIAYSPDGRLFAVASSIGVWLYDAGTGAEVKLLTGHTRPVTAVAFSPDGSMLASGSSGDETIRFWNVYTGEQLRVLKPGRFDLAGPYIYFLVFSPDGSTLAHGDFDYIVRFWDVRTGKEVGFVFGQLNTVVFSPDGSTLVTTEVYSPEAIWVWKVGQKKIVGQKNRSETLQGHTQGITSMAFSPDGATLVSGSWDRTIRFWNARTGLHLRTLEGHAAPVTSVAFSADGLRLASGSSDGTVRLWDSETGLHVRTLEAHTTRVMFVAFSPNGDVLTSQSDENIIRMWDTRTGEHVRTLALGGHSPGGNSVTFSPDGNIIASGSWDSTIRLWDVHTNEQLRTLEGHKRSILSVAYSPDGSTLASGNWDSTIRLWHARSGRHLNILEGHTDDVTSVVFSPDGFELTSGSRDGTILLWEVTHVTTWGSVKEDGVPEMTRELSEASPSAAPLSSTETALLPNYPNPFNPETWMPYHLANDADVTLTIYDATGVLVRQFDLGYQPAGFYTDRGRAVY